MQLAGGLAQFSAPSRHQSVTRIEYERKWQVETNDPSVRNAACVDVETPVWTLKMYASLKKPG